VTRETYELLESFMSSCMDAADCAHGPEHIIRVLNNALDIAAHEENVDLDVLIAACLLHDIGRRAQLENPVLCHAQVGAEMAQTFLSNNGFDDVFAEHVAACIRAHRYRKGVPCDTIEAKILFDSDKLDVTGALGIARTLHYGALLSEPLYSRDESGAILDGTVKTGEHSFLHEYNFKLRNIYDGFHTAYAAALAESRRKIAEDFYQALLSESLEAEHLGKRHLTKILEK